MDVGEQTRVYDDNVDPCGIVHVTVGDGGNREGLARKCVLYFPKLTPNAKIYFGFLHAAIC